MLHRADEQSWRAILGSDWPQLRDNVRIGIYSAIIGAVTVGNLINVQVVLCVDLMDGLWVLVRPNWRLQRSIDEADTGLMERANLKL